MAEILEGDERGAAEYEEVIDASIGSTPTHTLKFADDGTLVSVFRDDDGTLVVLIDGATEDVVFPGRIRAEVNHLDVTHYDRGWE